MYPSSVAILLFIVWTVAGFAWFLRMASVLQRNNDLGQVGTLKGCVLFGLGGPVIWVVVFLLALSTGLRKVSGKNSRFYNWLIR